MLPAELQDAATQTPGRIATLPNGRPDLYVHELAAAPKDPFTLTPGGIDFGPRALDSQTTRSFTLRNRGPSALAIGHIGIVGMAIDAFPMRTNCGTSLAAGASCRIAITFQPRVAARQVVVLKVVFEWNTHEIARSVAGTGVNP